MLATICIVWALICVVLGIILLFFPQTVRKLSGIADRQYSTDKLRELLDKNVSTEKLNELLHKQIDINEKLFKFTRFIGLLALIVGVALILLSIL